MSSGMEIAHGQVARNAASLRIHGEDYAAALQRLRERGYGCGSWGDDTGLFAAFHAEYSQCGVYAAEALLGISGVMGQTGDGLDIARGRIAEAEALAQEQSAKLYRELPL
ncbi:hypothetical protein E1286_09800 [Nonomuraea terrae]|uniref:WXG100 family type VII secretion target n=1 Tax=Nonomuraea terrae TaxID=2530383 RepID=A0A4R4Z1M2_9ACTN|nr:hypothetical protein [Nonomuraea terrae]TDD51795.1 hypothetical protein E1286_09800 [Nonomuraea terrae]